MATGEKANPAKAVLTFSLSVFALKVFAMLRYCFPACNIESQILLSKLIQPRDDFSEITEIIA